MASSSLTSFDDSDDLSLDLEFNPDLAGLEADLNRLSKQKIAVEVNSAAAASAAPKGVEKPRWNDVVKSQSQTTAEIKRLIAVTEKLSVGSLIKTTLFSPLVALTKAVEARSDKLADRLAKSSGFDKTLGNRLEPYFNAVTKNLDRSVLRLEAAANRRLGFDNKDSKARRDTIVSELRVPWIDRLQQIVEGSLTESLAADKVVLSSEIKKSAVAIKEALTPKPGLFLALKALADPSKKLEDIGEDAYVEKILLSNRKLFDGLVKIWVNRKAEAIASGQSDINPIAFQQGSKNIIGFWGANGSEGSTDSGNALADIFGQRLFGSQGIPFRAIQSNVSVPESLSKAVGIEGLPEKFDDRLSDVGAKLFNGVEETAARIFDAVMNQGVKPEDIILVGHSAGAMRANSVIELLEALGITGVKAVGTGGVQFGGKDRRSSVYNETSINDFLTGRAGGFMPANQFTRAQSGIIHSPYTQMGDDRFLRNTAAFLGVPTPPRQPLTEFRPDQRVAEKAGFNPRSGFGNARKQQDLLERSNQALNEIDIGLENLESNLGEAVSRATTIDELTNELDNIFGQLVDAASTINPSDAKQRKRTPKEFLDFSQDYIRVIQDAKQETISEIVKILEDPWLAESDLAQVDKQISKVFQEISTRLPTQVKELVGKNYAPSISTANKAPLEGAQTQLPIEVKEQKRSSTPGKLAEAVSFQSIIVKGDLIVQGGLRQPSEPAEVKQMELALSTPASDQDRPLINLPAIATQENLEKVAVASKQTAEQVAKFGSKVAEVGGAIASGVGTAVGDAAKRKIISDARGVEQSQLPALPGTAEEELTITAGDIKKKVQKDVADTVQAVGKVFSFTKRALEGLKATAEGIGEGRKEAQQRDRVNVDKRDIRTIEQSLSQSQLNSIIDRFTEQVSGGADIEQAINDALSSNLGKKGNGDLKNALDRLLRSVYEKIAIEVSQSVADIDVDFVEISFDEIRTELENIGDEFSDISGLISGSKEELEAAYEELKGLSGAGEQLGLPASINKSPQKQLGGAPQYSPTQKVGNATNIVTSELERLNQARGSLRIDNIDALAKNVRKGRAEVSSLVEALQQALLISDRLGATIKASEAEAKPIYGQEGVDLTPLRSAQQSAGKERAKLLSGILNNAQLIKNAADAGDDTAKGFIGALENAIPGIEKTSSKAAQSIIRSIKEVLQIKSPSRVMIEIGRFVAEGLVIGISTLKTDLFSSKIQQLAKAAKEGLKFVRAEFAEVGKYFTVGVNPSRGTDAENLTRQPKNRSVFTDIDKTVETNQQRVQTLFDKGYISEALKKDAQSAIAVGGDISKRIIKAIVADFKSLGKVSSEFEALGGKLFVAVTSKLKKVGESIVSSIEENGVIGSIQKILGRIGDKAGLLALGITGTIVALKVSDRAKDAIQRQFNFEASISGLSREGRQGVRETAKKLSRFGVDKQTIAAKQGQFADIARGQGLPEDFFAKAIPDFLKAASTQGLSTDQAERGLTTLGQVIDKGKLFAEEVQQFNEAIPGSRGVIAQSLGVKPEQLEATIQGGGVDVNRFARRFVQNFAGRQRDIDFTQSPEVADKRFGQAVDKLAIQSAGGLVTGLTKAKGLFADAVEAGGALTGVLTAASAAALALSTVTLGKMAFDLAAASGASALLGKSLLFAVKQTPLLLGLAAAAALVSSGFSFFEGGEQAPLLKRLDEAIKKTNELADAEQRRRDAAANPDKDQNGVKSADKQTIEALLSGDIVGVAINANAAFERSQQKKLTIGKQANFDEQGREVGGTLTAGQIQKRRSADRGLELLKALDSSGNFGQAIGIADRARSGKLTGADKARAEELTEQFREQLSTLEAIPKDVLKEVPELQAGINQLKTAIGILSGEKAEKELQDAITALSQSIFKGALALQLASSKAGLQVARSGKNRALGETEAAEVQLKIEGPELQAQADRFAAQAANTQKKLAQSTLAEGSEGRKKLEEEINKYQVDSIENLTKIANLESQIAEAKRRQVIAGQEASDQRKAQTVQFNKELEGAILEQEAAKRPNAPQAIQGVIQSDIDRKDIGRRRVDVERRIKQNESNFDDGTVNQTEFRQKELALIAEKQGLVNEEVLNEIKSRTALIRVEQELRQLAVDKLKAEKDLRRETITTTEAIAQRVADLEGKRIEIKFDVKNAINKVQELTNQTKLAGLDAFKNIVENIKDVSVKSFTAINAQLKQAGVGSRDRYDVVQPRRFLRRAGQEPRTELNQAKTEANFLYRIEQQRIAIQVKGFQLKEQALALELAKQQELLTIEEKKARLANQQALDTALLDKQIAKQDESVARKVGDERGIVQAQGDQSKADLRIKQALSERSALDEEFTLKRRANAVQGQVSAAQLAGEGQALSAQLSDGLVKLSDKLVVSRPGRAADSQFAGDYDFSRLNKLLEQTKRFDLSLPSQGALLPSVPSQRAYGQVQLAGDSKTRTLTTGDINVYVEGGADPAGTGNEIGIKVLEVLRNYDRGLKSGG